MTDGEKLDLLLNNMQTISGRLDSIEERVKQSEGTFNSRFDSIEERVKQLEGTVRSELDNIEQQVKQTERTLRNELRKSENLILDEVERIHDILDKHKEDKTVHTA